MEDKFTDDQFLARWLSGELSPEEAASFQEHADYALYERIRTGSALLKAPGFDEEAALSALKSRMATVGTPVVAMPQRKGRVWIYAVAASVVLIVGAWIALQVFFPSAKRIVTTAGAQTQVDLPDGSSVILNAESELNFLAQSNSFQKERKVFLQGEAFLTVQSGEGFQVVTENGQVEVLGTQFNVSSREALLMVQCYEGTVAVSTESVTDTLFPGDALRIENGKLAHAWKLDARLQPGWTTGISHFDQVPLSEVWKALERQYGIEIEATFGVTDETFTGDFVHDDLETALKMVHETFNISYSIQGKRVKLEH